MEIIMKKALIIVSAVSLVIIGFLVCIILFGEFWKKEEPKTSGVLLEKGTNSPTAYSFEILSKDKIENNTVRNWIEKCDSEPINDNIYHSLRNNRGSAMDIYIYMPSAKEIMDDINGENIRGALFEDMLSIHIDSSKKRNNNNSESLILHIYSTGGNTSTKSERLYINGKGIPCASTSLKTLN